MRIISSLAVIGILLTACEPALSQGKDIEKHPYDSALDYCSSRGGLARFTVTGSVFKFTCAEDLSKVLIVSGY
jgi:hypothetical protein